MTSHQLSISFRVWISTTDDQIYKATSALAVQPSPYNVEAVAVCDDDVAM